MVSPFILFQLAGHVFAATAKCPTLILHLDASDPRSYPGSGNVWYDLSGNGNNATLYSATASTGQLNFNGLNSYGQLPAGVYFNGNDFTIQSWIKSDIPSQTWSRVIDFGNGAGSDTVILVASAGNSAQPMLSIYAGPATQFQSTTALTASNWTNVAATFDSVNKMGYIYMNGQLTATMANMQTPRNIIRALNYIGRSNWAPDLYFKGSMRSVQIFNRHFTALDMENYAKSTVSTSITINSFKSFKLSNVFGTPIPNALMRVSFYTDKACSVPSGASSLTATTGSDGSATFSAWDSNVAGNYFFKVSYGSKSSTDCLSNVGFKTQPLTFGFSAVNSSLSNQPVVYFFDRNGNTVDGGVTLTAHSDSSCSTLLPNGVVSNNQVNSVNGLASFSKVEVNSNKEFYLRATLGIFQIRGRV